MTKVMKEESQASCWQWPARASYTLCVSNLSVVITSNSWFFIKVDNSCYFAVIPEKTIISVRLQCLRRQETFIYFKSTDLYRVAKSSRCQEKDLPLLLWLSLSLVLDSTVLYSVNLCDECVVMYDIHHSKWHFLHIVVLGWTGSCSIQYLLDLQSMSNILSPFSYLLVNSEIPILTLWMNCNVLACLSENSNIDSLMKHYRVHCH